MDNHQNVIPRDLLIDRNQQLTSTAVESNRFRNPLEDSRTHSNMRLNNTKMSSRGTRIDAQLRALWAQFSDRGHDHSLNLFLTELDALLARFDNSAAIAQPPHSNRFSSPIAAVHNDFDQSLVFDDRTTTDFIISDQSFTGFGISGVSDADFPRDTGLRFTNQEVLANTFQGFPDSNGVYDTSKAGNPFRLPNHDQPTWAGLHHDAETLQALNPNPSMYNSAVDFGPTGNDWDSANFNEFIGFDASSTQNLGAMNAHTLQQGTDLVSSPTNVLPNAAAPSTTAAGPAHGNFPCLNCTKTFSRRSDLKRHAVVHDPNAIRHYCPAQSCGFSSSRKDKLRDHQRKARH